MTTGTEPTLTTDEQVTVPRTPEELMARLKGQMEAAVKTANELVARDFRVGLSLHTDDVEQYFYGVVVSKTVYL